MGTETGGVLRAQADDTAEVAVGPIAPADALDAAIEAHHRRLTGLAFVMCGDRELAEDLVAEAYARVWPKVRDRQVDTLLPYLRRAVVNQVQGSRRRRVLEHRETEHRRRESTPPTRFEAGVDDQLSLLAALQQLPLDQRTVVVLRHVEDLSEHETAAVLRIPEGTVKSRLARGLAALRDLLEDPGDQSEGDAP